MKKTHFLQLEFHPGDKVWCIVVENENAYATQVEIQRAIFSIGKGEKQGDFTREVCYDIGNGLIIVDPLRTKEEAEALILKGNQAIETTNRGR